MDPESTFILNIDASTSKAVVAISKGPQLLAEKYILRQKSHSEMINLAIGEILDISGVKFKDLTAIGVTEGPGSFTGLRVSGNIAKGLAYSLNCPLVVFNSLEVLAIQANDKLKATSQKIFPMINAFKQMVFGAVYESRLDNFPVRLSLPQVFETSQLGDFITEPLICVGDGFDYYSDEFASELKPRLKREVGLEDFPQAEVITRLSWSKLLLGQTINWNKYVPLYLKVSEAEENLRKGLLHIKKLT